jgi:hypothetical protein
MTYTEQIEQYVSYYPQTVRVEVPLPAGVTALPSLPSVLVMPWEEDYCELSDVDGVVIARFRLVG